MVVDAPPHCSLEASRREPVDPLDPVDSLDPVDPVDPIDPVRAGVIREARRRQRRIRVSAGLAGLVIAAGLMLVLSSNGGSPGARPPRPLRPTWLAGRPLGRSANLRLVVSENTGPASIVAIGGGHTRRMPGLGVPRRQQLDSPLLYPLTPAPGGARAVVTRQPCPRCAITQQSFLISFRGSVRRTATLRISGTHTSTAPAVGSAAATWVLTQRARDRCVLGLEPSAHAAVPAPCGMLAEQTAAGLVIDRGDEVALVDPLTGRIEHRLAVRGQFDVIDRTFALISAAPAIAADGDAPGTALTLVNLSTGARMRLRWPSGLHFGYRVIPEPGGPLAIVEFADPAYGASQAADLWLLDPRTGTFAHVPGFPILEDLKFSGIAWTANHRVVAVAQGGGHTTIGVWRPGSRAIEVARVPALSGYSQIVPLEGGAQA